MLGSGAAGYVLEGDEEEAGEKEESKAEEGARIREMRERE